MRALSFTDFYCKSSPIEIPLCTPFHFQIVSRIWSHTIFCLQESSSGQGQYLHAAWHLARGVALILLLPESPRGDAGGHHILSYSILQCHKECHTSSYHHIISSGKRGCPYSSPTRVTQGGCRWSSYIIYHTLSYSVKQYHISSCNNGGPHSSTTRVTQGGYRWSSYVIVQYLTVF